MPELPEVETVARQLAPAVTGRAALALLVFDPKLENAARPALDQRHVAGVFRRGKQVLIEFTPGRGRSKEPEWLAVHLRMTGRLIWESGPVERARKHQRAALVLEGGAVNLYDPRRFGTLDWLRAPGDAGPIGIDPTGEAFTPEALAELVRGSRQPLKAWLLRQDRLVGLGNIYASEILHDARLHPARAAGSLRPDEIARLHASTGRILAAAIRHCGTTFSDFQDAHGVVGGFQEFLQVYDRAGQLCPRCGATIRKQVQQQRSTYWCPACAGTARRRVLGSPKKKERPAHGPA